MNKKYLSVIIAVALMMVFLSMSARASETDSRIEAAAKNSYTFKTYLKDDNIVVKSNEGMVTLTGQVSDENHRALAQNTVENLPEVKSVDNQLEVIEKNPPENSDAWISIKAKTSLLYHRNVSGVATQVYVKDGVVTLEGEASSQAQKDLTGEYVRNIDGVKDVKNNITVVDRPQEPKLTLKEKIDDASITGQVKTTLLFHRSTSGLKTGVDTNDGVVTLTGKAKSGAEKDLITKLVSDINGVERVVNNMSIE